MTLTPIPNIFPGTLEEAMGWVEYCNSNDDSHFANMRRQNGRDQPYGVSPSSLSTTSVLSGPLLIHVCVGQILGSRQRVLGPVAD